MSKNNQIRKLPTIREKEKGIDAREQSKTDRRKKFTKTGVVYSTKEYDLFDFFDENRDTSQSHVNSLRAAIRKHGNLSKEFSILVNRSFKIIDGQNRFLALSVDNRTVYFQITDRLSVDDIPRASALNKKWIMNDYLRSYVKRYQKGEKKYLPYAQFEGYMNRWGFSTSVVLVLLTGDRHTKTVNEFKNGNMKIRRDWQWLESFAEDLHAFSRWIDFYRHRYFVSAFIMIYNHPNYSHRVMMKKMEYISSYCVKQPDTFSYAKMMETIYNHKSRPDNKLTFVQDNYTINGKLIIRE